MPDFFNPPNVVTPPPSYSHGVTIGPNAKRLVISGQIGVRPDGSVAEGMKAQTGQAIDNLFNVVAAAGMTPTDIIKIVTYVTKAENIADMRAVRSEKFGTHAPTSTLLVIAGLADPRFLVEIEAEAVQEA